MLYLGCSDHRLSQNLSVGPLFVVLALTGVVLGRNVPQDDDEERIETPPSNFVGDGTNELATTLLQVRKKELFY